jgi:hypothetical protein
MLTSHFGFVEQVETLLKTQSPSDQAQPSPVTTDVNIPMGDADSRDSGPAGEDTVFTHIPKPPHLNCGPQVQSEQSYSWEMIGLGLEEPLPTQDAINEL